MRILITGAGGFLGSYLARYLAKNHTVSAMTRLDLDLMHADQVRQCFQTNFDAVIHCASMGRNSARSFDQKILVDNLTSWNNLLTYKNKFGILINIASGAEFDITKNIDHARETDIWNVSPAHSYGLSKNIIARMCQQLNNTFNLRLFGCFDPSENQTRPIRRCGQEIRAGKPFVIHGDKPFDMISVRDFAVTVDAVLAGHISDNDVNVVYNKKHTLSDILKIYCKQQGLDEKLVQVETVDPNSYTGDGSRLAKYNLPLLGLEQSLKEYI